MDRIATIEALEDALTEAGIRGVQLSFGPSASPLRQGQWFASIGGDQDRRQVRAATLSDALNGLLGNAEVVDVTTEPVRVKHVPKPAAPPPTDLGSLLE